MASIQNKVIHRFVCPISDYEKGGVYYTQVIPLDTQAYAIYPLDEEKNGLWYVLGDGNHTYTEIRDGKGDKDSAKEYPVFTEDFIEIINDTYSKEEVDELIKHTHSFRVAVVDELPEIGEDNVLYLVTKKSDDSNIQQQHEHNYYDEYVWLDNYYEYIGNTGSAGDCVTHEELDEILENNLSAEFIKYVNENYEFTNIKEALDSLLYKLPEVNLYGGKTYEKGTIVNTVDLNWNINKKIVTQSIDQGIGTLNKDLRDYTVENAGITDDITYTITVSDGRNSARSSTNILFRQYLYWGVSASTDLDNDKILIFSKEFETTNINRVTFDCSGGKYFYIISPAKYSDDILFKINGFVFSDMIETTIKLTNSSGYTSDYIVYRSNNIQTGSSIEVEYFI